MNRVETAAGAIVLGAGVSLLAGASSFPFIFQGIPGPGFLPFLIALGIVGSGIALIVSAIRGANSAPRAVNWPRLSGWARVGMLLGAMALSFVLLEALGFLVVTALFMVVMIYCLGERSWRMLATVPVLSSAALYGVFAVWLRVPLPKGIITFIG